MTVYSHGVRVTESPTSILSVVAASGLPVVVGTAPINQGADQSYVNKPLLAYTKEEAVKALGYSDDWTKFSLCEVMRTHFDLYNVAPVVFINVLDPVAHKTTVTDQSTSISSGTATVNQLGVLLNTVVAKLTSGGTTLVKDTDYSIGFNSAGKPVLTRIGGAWLIGQTTLSITYDYLDTTKVVANDIIGGINGTTGAYTGLELLNKVFPLFQLVPGLLLAPGWSKNPTVEAVMTAKAANINGLFKASVIADVDSSSSGADLYSEVPAWKSTNGYTEPSEVVCWPKVKLGSDTYYLSSHVAGLMCKTDAANDDLPFVSPSNKSLQVTAAVIANGAEVTLEPEQANYLNGQGVVTALNFSGWKLWGNRTGAYPTSTDVKDSFVPVRRMFNWVANSIILTFWKNVDDPTNRRLIETVTDTLNIWLNGLTARGALLGGRVEFRASENPTTDLINGTVRFRVLLAAPVPAEEIEFALEFDTNYLSLLFAG